jgi:hypothetical protein
MQPAEIFYLITLEGCRDYAVTLKDWQKAVLPTLRKIIQPKNWPMEAGGRMLMKRMKLLLVS